MSYASSRVSEFVPYRPAPQNDTRLVNVLMHLQESIPPSVRQWVTENQNRLSRSSTNAAPVRSTKFIGSLAARIRKRIFTLANGLIVIWILTLLWGERTVFKDSVEGCRWETWETWPQGTTPHHVAFIADPQLVDPHTYPGRPWPLSMLTVKYTDQYLRRSFSLIQQSLAPDSVLFLGDLFDGGREWATGSYSSPEKRYKRYKDDFWKKEFRRFVRIFSNHFNDGDSNSTSFHGRQMIASLPGNHDLGFGTGVEQAVRERFQSFFGKSNRVDIIGNHTFVAVDTVSLSAMDQPDPVTGSTGAGLGDGNRPNEWIWKEAEDFLNNLNYHRGLAEAEELRMLRNESEGLKFKYTVLENVLESAIHQKPEPKIVGFPTILLTHVPLYRKQATPCGPLRERYPPSSDDDFKVDERNSIKVAGGYQYQNVLTPTISNDVVSKIGPNLVQVYSGDDHDYCEILHHEYSGSPKEITVKSLSWAMGVRRPGILLTSLWNPIDIQTGKSLDTRSSSATLQNHLCLFPDQLSIFICYGWLLGFTLLAMLIRSIVMAHRPPVDPKSPGPLLPLSEKRDGHSFPSTKHFLSTSSSTPCSFRGLASRAANAPPNLKSYSDEYPVLQQEIGISNVMKSKSWKPTQPRRKLHIIRYEFLLSVKQVALFVIAWYFYLIWLW